jgi:hypothetical protein
MVGSGAVILTEERIILCGSKSDMSASATDKIAATTMCTFLCWCCPSVWGCCGCLEQCRRTSYSYEQVANRENHDQQNTIKLSNAQVCVRETD